MCLLSFLGIPGNTSAIDKKPEKTEIFQTDPEALRQQEVRGLNAAAIFAKADGNEAKDLDQSKLYLEMVGPVSFDIDAEKRFVEKTITDPTRKIEFFKTEWLRSPKTNFYLVGIVPRPDRQRNAPKTCGEVRLIYRLGYEQKNNERQFLPMTMMAAFELPAPKEATKCEFSNDNQERLLSDISTGKNIFDRIEINLLISSWSFSGTEPLSEQAKYLLRVFKLSAKAGHLYPAPLENTPDVKKITENPVLLKQFTDWIKNEKTISDVAAGFFHLPTIFAAEKALSVSPYASAHTENTPFTQIIGTNEQALQKTLERMDSLTCQGCHQIRSLAGFHFPGVATATNSTDLISPVSPHFLAIQKWRAEEISTGKSHDFPDLLSLVKNKEGSGCADKVCPIEEEKDIGSNCDPSLVSPRSDGTGAHFVERPLADCGANRFCAFAKAGFPGGYCSAYCGKVSVADNCFPVPSLGPFTACVDNSGDHSMCAKKHSTPAKMKTCKEHSDCRNDYACITSQDNLGICGPNYLVPGLTLKHAVGS